MLREDKMKICPACGFKFGKKYKFREESSFLIEDRHPNTVDMLRTVVNLIQRNITADRDTQRVFYFLQAISKCSDEVIEWAINQYYAEGHYTKMKGLSYLKIMILNHKKNRSKMLKNEELMYGTSPKKINLKKEK